MEKSTPKGAFFMSKETSPRSNFTMRSITSCAARHTSFEKSTPKGAFFVSNLSGKRFSENKRFQALPFKTIVKFAAGAASEEGKYRAAARCEVKCATHFLRNFTAKQLHDAKHHFMCHKAHFVRKKHPEGCFFRGAADRDRTGTLFRARDFKSLVSAYSTTAAYARAAPGF